MTSSLLLKCNIHTSTVGGRPRPILLVARGVRVPKRAIFIRRRRDRCMHSRTTRGSIRSAVVKASKEREEGIASIAKVKFQCQASVEFGESMKIVGGADALGNWDLDAAPGLVWGEGDVWTAMLDLPTGTYELKCVKIRRDGSADWEPGENRILEVSGVDATQEALEVNCRFFDSESTAIAVRSLDEINDEAFRENEAQTSSGGGPQLPWQSNEAARKKGNAQSNYPNRIMPTPRPFDARPTANGKAEGPNLLGCADGFAVALGFIAVPVVAWSESTGCGLPPGPGGFLGVLEGFSYMSVLGLATYFLFRRFSGGSKPEGAAVAVEVSTYGTILGGLAVLALQIQAFGYVPSRYHLADDKCPAQPIPFDLSEILLGFSKLSVQSLPLAPPLVSATPPQLNPSVPNNQAEVETVIPIRITPAAEN